jgi:hypothetical protein
MDLHIENARQKQQFPLEIYRQNYSVGVCGIYSKYFATLGKIRMDYVRLEIHR